MCIDMNANEQMGLGFNDPYTGPPAPWHLEGVLHASLWSVPARDIPPHALPRATQPIRLGGKVLVVTGWAHYTPPGTLAYDELLQGVAVRRLGSLLPAVTIQRIWVDDALAAQGGRVLWSIPKQMASFQYDGPDNDENGRITTASMSAEGALVAELVFRPDAILPVRAGGALRVVQGGQDGRIETRCALSGQPRYGRAQWTFSPDGPLAFLRGHAPRLTVRMERLRARFG